MTYVNALITGLVVGGSYSLMAVGISLIFSTTGVLNLAHAGFAMEAGYIYANLTREHGWGAWPAALVAVALVAVLGVLVERVVIRRVVDAPGTVRFVVTLGLLSLMTGVTLQVFGFRPKAPPPLFESGRLQLGSSVDVSYQEVAVIVAAVVLVAGLSLFLRLTRTGLAIRAVADDQTVARLMGVRHHRIAALNWAIASTLAAVAGVLLSPLTILTVGTFPLLVLKALGATLFGGVSGMLGSFVGGFVLGGAESLAFTRWSVVGVRELTVSLIILVLLFTRKKWPAELTTTRVTEGVSDSQFSSLFRTVLVGAVVLALVNVVRSDFWGQTGTLALVTALGVLGLVVLTGFTGQVSLMQGGLMGLGGLTMANLYGRQGWPLAFAILGGAVVAMLASGLLAYPSRRLSGLQMGIATLAVTAGISEWLLNQDLFPTLVTRPSYLSQDRQVFYLALPITLLAILAVWNLRRGVWGRRFFAVRYSDETAAHFAIAPVHVRTVAFMISGLLAGLGGCFFVLLLQGVTPVQFGVQLSIALLLYTIACGAQSLASPLVAALVFGFLPQVLTKSQTGASTIPDISAGLLIIGLASFRPGGLATLLTRRKARPGVGGELAPALVPRPPRRGGENGLPARALVATSGNGQPGAVAIPPGSPDEGEVATR